MDYFIFKIDSSGYTYSIDNVICEYIIKYHKDITEYLHELVKMHDLENEYWEKLNCPNCSKYQFYSNHYHLCNGIYIMSGRFSLKSDLSKTYDIFPIIKIEINPNKHAKKPIFNDLLKWLNENCGDCSLKRYDFCVDVPVSPDKISVFGSRKEKGLYKGTRYYGQRNKDGYLKIYDKKKEQDLENDLTRIEYTLVNDKTGNCKKGLNLQNIYILSEKKNDTSLQEKELKGMTKAVIKFYSLCMASGIDCEDIISDLDRRTQKLIYDNISGYIYKPIEIDINLHDQLLQEIKNLFGVIEQKTVFEDSDGFLRCEQGFEDLPFD